MGFIETFFRKKPKAITRKDVETFISRKKEENLNLDYKAIKAYSDFDELSKDVSAFANSDGGLLILGVSQKEIKIGRKVVKILPKEITWGEETHTKEQLEDNLIGKIRPRIDGLRIQPVREGNGSLRVVFLLDTPQSDNRPHMASDNKYYKRLNFRKTPMEHYEVANLFKMKWPFREKLVEKIYEPLASVLEKHTKKLEKYEWVDSREIEDILSQTYYKRQIPFELLEGLYNYFEEIKDFLKKEHYGREEMKNILRKNVLEYLRLDYKPSKRELRLEFQMIFEKTKRALHLQEMYELLLENKSITKYTDSLFYSGVCEKIEITYSNEKHHLRAEIKLGDFDEHIWKKCLKQVSESTQIAQMKESANNLLDEADYLIDEIMKC